MKVTRKQLRKHLNYLLKETRIYGSNDIEELDDTDNTVSLIMNEQSPFNDVKDSLNRGTSSDFPDNCKYYKVVNPALSERLINSHGQGSTEAGNIGETIVSILSSHIGSDYPDFAGIIATENLNDRYPNLGIPSGFFPGMDIIGYKSSNKMVFSPVSGDLNFSDHAHLCSAKRGGSPKAFASVRRSNILERNANQAAQRNIAVVLGLRWLQDNATATVEDPLNPGINNESSRADVLNELLGMGITTITYTFADLQINTIPYLNKADITDPTVENMSDTELSEKFPLLEAIAVHPGGRVIYDVASDTATYSGASGIHGTGTTNHQLAGILISGGIADLSGEGKGRTDDILHALNVSIDLSELPFELNGNEIFGEYENLWNRIIRSTMSGNQTRFKTALKDKLNDTAISNASSEFKTAVSLLDKIDSQLLRGQSFINPDLPLPGRSPTGETLNTVGVDIKPGDKAKLAMTSGGQGSASGIKDKYIYRKGRRNKKKSRNLTDDLLAYYDPSQAAELGVILRQFIVNNLTGDIDDSQSVYDKLIVRENLNPDDSILLQSIDDWLDSVRMYVAYLALFTIKCIKQGNPSDPVNDLLEIARDYKSIADAEALDPVGLAPAALTIKTQTDSDGKVTFPGMRESFKRKKGFLLKELRTPFEVASTEVVAGITSLSTLVEAITSAMEEYNSESPIDLELLQNKEDIIVNPDGTVNKQVIARPAMAMAGVEEGKIRNMIRESIFKLLKR